MITIEGTLMWITIQGQRDLKKLMMTLVNAISGAKKQNTFFT